MSHESEQPSFSETTVYPDTYKALKELSPLVKGLLTLRVLGNFKTKITVLVHEFKALPGELQVGIIHKENRRGYPVDILAFIINSRGKVNCISGERFVGLDQEQSQAVTSTADDMLSLVSVAMRRQKHLKTKV